MANKNAVVAQVSVKRCPHCESIKCTAEFNKNRHRPDGLQDRCRACRKSMYWANPDVARANTSDWRRKNPERARLSTQRWCQENPDRLRDRTRIRAAGYRKNPIYRLAQAMRTAVGNSMRGIRVAGRLAHLDYSIEELRSHIEKQFVIGMSWSNYGQWHVDHIIPLSSFRISGPSDADFKRAWALSNLRPLWARDNLSKGSRIEELL